MPGLGHGKQNDATAAMSRAGTFGKMFIDNGLLDFVRGLLRVPTRFAQDQDAARAAGLGKDMPV